MFSAKAILQANGGSEKVCRNLFGEVDHEQLKEDFTMLMSDTLEEAKRTWNFDFLNETPLEGDYEWERVKGPHQETTPVDGDRISSLVSVQEPESRGSNCKRKQALITDYYQVKRRCSPLPSPSRCSL